MWGAVFTTKLLFSPILAMPLFIHPGHGGCVEFALYQLG